MSDNPFVGSWSYRSFLNDPSTSLDSATADQTCQILQGLVFGYGTITIEEAPLGQLRGTIGGTGWSLALKGSRTYGDPMTARFQGTGRIDDEPWAYDYVAYLPPEWVEPDPLKAEVDPDSKSKPGQRVPQPPALVGSIVRVLPHSGGDGTIHPAGVVASWYAVRQP